MSSIDVRVDDSKHNGSKNIWLPTECWVDTLKLLSRRQLLQHVQPMCRRLHSISELHVPNLHIIRNFAEFLDGLERNLPEANKQHAELAASKADLARHFRLGENVKFSMERRKANQNKAAYKRRRRYQMCVLRHSLELFRGCQLHLMMLHPTMANGESADELLAYMSLLAPARPFCIEVVQDTKLSELRGDELLRESTILACPRLIFTFFSQYIPSAETICHWLHHSPIEEDMKEENEEAKSPQTRIFNLMAHILPSTGVEIVERCKQSLQQAESVSDQRSFLFIFQMDGTLPPLIPPFKLENGASGEVLQLERQEQQNAAGGYRLQRCPAMELANEDKFYRDTFRAQSLHYRAPLMDNGLEAPILRIARSIHAFLLGQWHGMLSHSLEMFHGCVLQLVMHHHPYVPSRVEELAGEFMASLALLAPARAISIQIVHGNTSPELRPDVLLREPAMLACSKLNFFVSMLNVLPVETICQWLHHLPIAEENDGSDSAQTRIFILRSEISFSSSAEIIERCKQSLLQAESASDRRSFLLSFQLGGPSAQLDDLITPFKLENDASGEMLELKEQNRGHWVPGMGERGVAWVIYHLRRCPTTELAREEQFYQDTFLDQKSCLYFRDPQMDNGSVVHLRTPVLKLCCN